LYHVDFEDDDRPRTPKDSAVWYRQLIEDHGFPELETKADDRNDELDVKIPESDMASPAEDTPSDLEQFPIVRETLNPKLYYLYMARKNKHQ
jgi:hypothetical protein